MYQILVVDDDESIVAVVAAALEREGYMVTAARNGEEACLMVQRKRPHLVIMDVMMPKVNGLMATMRIPENSNIPILMLSAKAEGSDRVLGLEAGADDYLIKPFYQQELLARVRALLRRYHDLGSVRDAGSADQIRIGDIVLDKTAKSLIVRGEPVRLTPTEYKILSVMMANPGRVFPAEELYERVWQIDAYAVENHQSIREALDVIPDDAAVTASTFYTTYLSQRDVIYDLGYASKAHILESEYIIIDPGHDTDWVRLAGMLEQNGYIRTQSENIPILIYRRPLPG